MFPERKYERIYSNDCISLSKNVAPNYEVIPCQPNWTRAENRKRLQNEGFVWSPENVKRLRNLNGRLRDIQSELTRREAFLMESIGSSRISFFVTLAIDVWDGEGNVSEEEECSRFYALALSALENPTEEILHILYKSAYGDVLSSYMDRTNAEVNGYSLTIVDADADWNVGVFNRPEMESVKVCFLMYVLFEKGLYSLRDALRVRESDIVVQSLIGMDVVK